MDPAQAAAAVPTWLPVWMEGTWSLLAVNPLLLAAAAAGTGIVLAVTARGFILYWGLKLARRTRTELDSELVRVGARVAAILLAYAGLLTAARVLPLTDPATTLVTRLLTTLMVLQLMRAALRAGHVGLEVLSAIRDRFEFVEERTIPLFDLVFTIVVVGVAAYLLIGVWDADVTAWLASAGILGIVVGFAAQDTIANLFAGFFIIADAPYKVGDYVVLDSGERGAITKVGVRSTRMLTRDDIEIIIPNSMMAKSKIVNESGGPSVKFRIRIAVGVAYGSDVDRIVEILEEVAHDHGRVCADPRARVHMKGFGDSSLDFDLLCWVEHPAERGPVSHQLYMAIYKALARESIEIPFPQRDIWVRSAAAAESPAALPV